MFCDGGEGGWAAWPLVGHHRKEIQGKRAAGEMPVTGIIMSTRIHLSMDMCVFALPSQLNQD